MRRVQEVQFGVRVMVLGVRGKATVTTSSVRQIETGKDFNSIPGPKGVKALKNIGMRFMLSPFSEFTPETIVKLFDSLHHKYGPIYRLRLGPAWAVITTNVDDVTSVIKNEGEAPFRKVYPLLDYAYKKTGVKASLGALNGHEWKKLRQAVQTKIVRPKSALHYLDVQNRVTRDFIERIEKKKFTPTELSQEYFKYACESVGVVCFNARLGCFAEDSTQKQETEQLVHDIHTMFELQFTSNTKFPLYKYMRTKMYNDFEKAFQSSLKVSHKLISSAFTELSKRREDGTLDLEEPNLLLSLMSSGKLNQEEITAVANDLFLAGTDSTAWNLQMMTYLLAKYPDCQEKLYKEIVQNVDKDGDLTVDALANMHYLKAFVRESFRTKFPVSVGIVRVLMKETTLSGYQVPAMTVVLCNNRRMCLMPQYFDHPESFMPERWIRDDKGKRERDIASMVMLPFGVGVRSCVGRRFAEQSLYLALVKLVQAFNIKPGKNFEEPEIIYHVFIRSRKPMDLEFEKR